MAGIRNRAKLATSAASADALEVIASGMGAASPAGQMGRAVARNTLRAGRRVVRLGPYRRLCVIAYGKAAGPMAEAADRGAKVSEGVVVIPEGAPRPRLGSKYRVMRSTHPTPSAKSVRAADALLKLAGSLEPDDYALFLVSGGGSAMLAAPLGVSLGDKMRVNDLLIRSGADIGEINCVRRRLSRIKGGGLVRNLRCRGAALIMSDVQGDRPYDVASGCTQADPTTFADALGVLRKYRLAKKVPKVAGALAEGAKTENIGRRRRGRVGNYVIARNADCVRAMTATARKLGYSVSVTNSYGDVDKVARRIVSKLRKRPMSCVVFGGEPTVRVRGKGRGGRNQELVARILLEAREKGLAAASVGTDGIDGNTPDAGALAESPMAPKSEITAHLRRSDSNALFARHGRLVKTGPTGANLQDVGVLIRRG